MALSASPRKMVPLAMGNDWSTPAPMAAPSVIRRVFYCGVVMRNISAHDTYSQDVRDLVSSFGDSVMSGPMGAEPQLESGIDHAPGTSPSSQTRKRALTDSSALSSVIMELVSTERSYVQRLRALKHDYADPLRNFSRNKNTAIIPPYEAKTLFGNVDTLLPVNEAFLADLELMMLPNGPQTVGGVGQVALRHFKDLKGFENYKQYYTKREEAQSIFEREMSKKGFSEFVERIKYSSSDIKNRVGLRELLMEPIQRIPRYTLLFRMMIKHMAPGDPQRVLLLEADDLASKIAQAEMDEQTKRAAIIHCLCSTVDNFPPGLISDKRKFIDCIDVDDLLTEAAPFTSPAPGAANNLNCTLLLFDDKLMILKRPGQERSGRALAGLDELEKMTRSGGLPLGMKKSGLSCKGVVDITEVVATDVGPSEFHLYLENPPTDDSDRWSNRSFRSLTVVYPPSPSGLVPDRTKAAKTRFLQNLYEAQALYRTKNGQSVALCGDEHEVETKRGRITFARTYFNVYQRNAFLNEKHKPKVVVHIDEFGSADPLPITGGPPYVIIRVQPMAGDLSRYTVTSTDPHDDSEEDIVQTARVAGRVVQTIQQYGLFKFRTGRDSAPATPSTSMRSRAGIFGLDVISRNLFNSKGGSSKSDIFGGSMASRRTRSSVISRSNTSSTATTSHDGSIAKFSQRSRSTAATSVYGDDDVSIASKPRSISRSRKLFKRGKSPANGSESDYDRSPSRLSQSQGSHSRAASEDPESDPEQVNDHVSIAQAGPGVGSEWDLAMRLNLARQNSQAQSSIHQFSMSEPVDAPVYEDPPPEALRPQSRASRDTASYRSVTPTPQDGPDSRLGRPLLASSSSSDHRPFGPRSPSPLPLLSPTSTINPLPALDMDFLSDDADAKSSHSHTSSLPVVLDAQSPQPRSPLPRSRPMQFDRTNSMEATPKAAAANTSVESKGSAIGPLLIKKKTSLREEPSPTKRYPGIELPLIKPLPRTEALSRPAFKQLRSAGSEPLRSGDDQPDAEARVRRLAEATKLDIDTARGAVKRIKLEVSQLLQTPSVEPASPIVDRPGTPLRNTRIPVRAPAAPTREAQARIEEMHALIAKRGGSGGGHSRTSSTRSIPEETAQTPPPDNFTKSLKSLEELSAELDMTLTKGASNHEHFVDDVQSLIDNNQAKSTQIANLTQETQNQRRQLNVLKGLYDEEMRTQAAMFDEANLQLDQLFEHTQLPPDEAWVALSTDLRQSQVAQYNLNMENSKLKRKLADLGHDWSE